MGSKGRHHLETGLRCSQEDWLISDVSHRSMLLLSVVCWYIAHSALACSCSESQQLKGFPISLRGCPELFDCSLVCECPDIRGCYSSMQPCLLNA